MTHYDEEQGSALPDLVHIESETFKAFHFPREVLMWLLQPCEHVRGFLDSHHDTRWLVSGRKLQVETLIQLKDKGRSNCVLFAKLYLVFSVFKSNSRVLASA